MGRRDQGNVSAGGILSVTEVTVRDTTSVSASGILSVVQIDAPDVDRTWVDENGILTAGPSVGYTAEALALFARFSTPPTDARKRLIDTLIGSLKTAGIWSKLDAFYMLAAADAQSSLLNWVSTSYNLTAVNSPVLVADRGYTGDGSTSYLDTGFNPTTAVGAKFVQDSANMGLWSRTDLQNAAASSFDMGQTNAQIDRIVSVAGRATGRANTGSGVTFGDGFYPKHAMWSRTAAAVWESYAQGVDAGGGTTVSAAMTNANFRILSVAAGQFGANQIAAAHYGSGLSAGEAAALYAALNTFMVAVGAA